MKKYRYFVCETPPSRSIFRVFRQKVDFIILDPRPMTDEMRTIYESWSDSSKDFEDLLGKYKEIKEQELALIL